ncbi:MAG: BatD family protein [Desulfuromusa sp.]|nr:BatD family protein [Desulfuromusa sp.]
MVNGWRIPFFVLGFLFLWINTVAAINVQAVADRDRIASGDSLQLQLRVDGSPDGDPDLTELKKNWDVLRQSESSQMQILNGKVSRSVVYRLTLMPKATGTLLIPEVCFATDCSRPILIGVAKTLDKGDGAGEPLILETEVNPLKIVSQGQLLFKVRLLRHVDLLDGQLNEPQPTGVAAVVKKLGDDRSYETRRNGQLYQVIERNYAIFPQGSGQMQIPALQFDGSIATGRTRFDRFGQQGQRVRRTSQALQVEILPLPADLNRRPWIPAVALELQDDWQQHPPKLTVGEPATRTLRLSARGVLSAQLPDLRLTVPDGFKSYPDQPKRDDAMELNGIIGRLEQKIALVPTRAGHYSLPAVDLDWWDVAASRWRTAHLDPLELDVAPAAGGTVSTSTAPQTQQQGKLSIPTSSPVGGAAVSAPLQASETTPGFWPWLSLGMALGWLVTLVFFWRIRRRKNTSLKNTSKEVAPDEKAARQILLRAVEQNDPQATRQALVLWSRILYPAAVGPYEQLCAKVPVVFAQELHALDRALYSSTGSSWNGQNLAVQLKNWQPLQVTKNADSLPELYS